MLQKGFSLLEMLATLAISCLLLLGASSPFAQLIQANRQLDTAQALASTLRTARSEAILRQHGTLTHALNGDWSEGWRVILDISGKGTKDPDNPVLLEHRATSRTTIVGNRPVQDFVRFSRLGEPLLPSGAFQAGTLHICAVQDASSEYQVVLARSGRVSLRNAKAEQALCGKRA